MHYYAVVERLEPGTGTFWISFPGRAGLISAADEASQIVAQAQDALASLLIDDAVPVLLPPSIEDGAKLPTDLNEYNNPFVVVIPFKAASERPIAA